MMWGNAGRFARVQDKALDFDASEQPDAGELEYDSPQQLDAEKPDLLKITRRRASFGKLKTHVVPCSHYQDLTSARNICVLQDLYKAYVNEASKMYPPAVWRLLNATHGQSKQMQTKVLKAVCPLLSAAEKRDWPKKRKTIDNHLQRKLGCFHGRVVRNEIINLKHLGLHDIIQFTFLVPIFAWVQCASKLSCEHALHFQYKSLHHPSTGELMYGTSVCTGEIMKRACERLPQ